MRTQSSASKEQVASLISKREQYEQENGKLRILEREKTEEREKLIQSGRHYCEMLPIEYVPTEKYMQVYYESLKNYSKIVANAVGNLADKIINSNFAYKF